MRLAAGNAGTDIAREASVSAPRPSSDLGASSDLGPSPNVVSISPAANAINVPLGADIVVTFDEAVKANSGLIDIVHNGIDEDTSIGNTSIVTFSGNTMTVHLGGYFTPGTAYQIAISGGSVESLSGAVAASAINLSFTTEGSWDGHAPILNGSDPFDGSTGASTTNVSLTFDEQISVGTGHIEVHRVSDGSLVESISVTDASHVSLAGSSLFISLPTALQSSTSYYITMDAGIVHDSASRPYAGISSSTGLNFTTASNLPPADTTPPHLITTFPSDGATGFPTTSSLGLSFDEPIKAGSGNIVIHNASDGSVFESIPVDDASRVHINAVGVSVDPTANFVGGASYYVTMAAGVFDDIAGNPFAGISSSTAFDFTAGCQQDMSGKLA